MASHKSKKSPKPPKVEVVVPKEKSDTKILAFIERCENPAELESLIRNATGLGNMVVAEKAFRKRISLVPVETPGTMEHDFWQTVHAFEYALSAERGRTVKLSRTRQKVADVGVAQTLRNWAPGSQEAAGFQMLLARGMPEFTGEATTLRHPEHFEPQILEAARERLTKAGVDLSALP